MLQNFSMEKCAGSRSLLISIGLIIMSEVMICGVNSFSVSVPPVRSVCRTMVPGHDKYKPQESDSPFIVSTDVKEVPSGGVVEVTLQGTGNRTFQGYYVQARDDKNMPIGMFNANTLAKVHSCNGVRYNAAHHANSEEKKRITVSWQAPKRYKGEIQFMYDHHLLFSENGHFRGKLCNVLDPG